MKQENEQIKNDSRRDYKCPSCGNISYARDLLEDKVDCPMCQGYMSKTDCLMGVVVK